MKWFATVRESKALPWMITGLGALLRLRYVGSSYCIDDWTALRDSLYPLPFSVEKFRPVFFTLLHYWRCLGPETEWWIQLLPFLFSAACVPLAWLVGKRLGGRSTGAALALLMAVSPIHIDLTSELRMYGLMSLFGLVQLLCYLDYRERRKVSSLVASTLVGTLAMYTQPIYVLFLAGMFVLALLDRQSLPLERYLLSLLAVAVLYTPGVIHVLAYAEHVQAGPRSFTTHVASAPFKLIAAYTTGFTYFRVHDLGLGAKFGLRELIANWPLAVVAGAAFAWILIGAIRQRWRTEERLSLYLFVTLVILPFALAYAGVVAIRKDFTHAQYHITSLPLILLFFIKGFQGWGGKRAVQALGIALYALVVALGLFRFLFDTRHFGRRVDWHYAARYLEQHVSPAEPLMLIAPPRGGELEYPYLLYYAHGTSASWLPLSPPARQETPASYADYLRERLAGHRTAYYLWDPMVKNIRDPQNVIVHSMRLIGTDEHEERVNPRLSIFRWRLREQ